MCDQAPWFAGSSWTHAVSVAFGNAPRACFSSSAGSG